MTVTEQLARLTNRATRYEVVAQRPDGTTALVGYTPRRTLSGLRDAAGNRGTELVAWLDAPPGAEMSWRRGCTDTVQITGGGIVRFSGRTQREAICAGALPSITQGATP